MPKELPSEVTVHLAEIPDARGSTVQGSKGRVAMPARHCLAQAPLQYFAETPRDTGEGRSAKRR